MNAAEVDLYEMKKALERTQTVLALIANDPEHPQNGDLAGTAFNANKKVIAKIFPKRGLNNERADTTTAAGVSGPAGQRAMDEPLRDQV